MPKQKRDWNKVKLEFIQSDFDEVKQFMQDKYNIYNWEIAKNTKGRTKDKVERKKKILEKALEKSAKKQADSLELTIEFLKKAKKNALIKIAKQITTNDLMSVKDLVRWLWTIKTELWEPTKITKNENMNKEENVSLTDEELEALKIILKKNK